MIIGDTQKFTCWLPDWDGNKAVVDNGKLSLYDKATLIEEIPLTENDRLEDNSYVLYWIATKTVVSAIASGEVGGYPEIGPRKTFR
jgi:hypothetical protein